MLTFFAGFQHNPELVRAVRIAMDSVFVVSLMSVVLAIAYGTSFAP